MATGIGFRWSSRAPALSVSDYRERARRALPHMVWAYLDGGAEDHVTLSANESGFGYWALRRRALVGVEARNLSVQVADTVLSLPVAVAPTGLSGLAHHTGEVAIAQAAESAGTVATLSTAASYSIEEVAAETRENHWFQLYPWASGSADARELTGSFVARARQSGFRALVVTVDVPALGNREDERRTGMGLPPVLSPRRLVDGARHPRWTYHFFRQRRFAARILNSQAGLGAALDSVHTQLRMFLPELNWDDLAWLRDQWEGPLLVKGILDPDDAERAIAVGATGVIVSNHGGRQLDGAPAAIHALPAVAARVGQRAEVLLDGGVRRGTDVVKALCLGADAVMIGRPALYGLAACGRDGVERVIEILREETARTMTLMGVARPQDLGPEWLVRAGRPLHDEILTSAGEDLQR